MHPPSVMQVASGPPPGTHAFDRHLSPLSNALGKYADPKTARAGRHPSSTCRICAGLLSVLAVVAVTLKFFRFCYDLGGRGDLSRRLAGREPAPEEDLDLSTIIEMCLDMEEEISVGPQTPAVPPEGQWEQHSSWQLLTPYQQSQQTIPAVPSSAEWGSFQQSEGGQFFEPTPISLVQGDYDQGWPHSVEEAHQMPLEGPSELWQGSSVLPPYSGSPFTTASEGSTSTAPPWPTSAPSQFQNLGLGSSFAASDEHVVPGLPTAMELPNPVHFGGVSSSQQMNIQASPDRTHLVSLQADVRQEGASEGGRFHHPHTLEVPHVFQSHVTSPIGPTFGEYNPSAYAGLSSAFLPEGQSSASVNQQVTAAAGVQNPSSSTSLQTPVDEGTDQHADGPLSIPPADPRAFRSHHPFYKLPVVDTEIALSALEFSANEAFSGRSNINVPSVVLRNLHNCLAKDKLTLFEANDIVRSAQRLAGHLYFCHKDSVAKSTPAEAVAILGRRYIMLELLLCAVQVLGPAMNASAWWKELASAIPSEVTVTPSHYVSKRCKPFAHLATRLSSAIGLLKQGIRPNEEETIALKQALFCNKQTHSEFRMPRWNLWRQDDKKAGSGQHG